MAVPISNVVRRIVFAPSGTGPYAFTFEILAATDIEVYKGDNLLTLTTDYTVTINSNGTGSVTLVATAGTDNITVVGARAIQRSTDFVTGGDFFANSLNTELDSLTIFTQQNAEAVARSLTAPVTDPTTIDMTLPRAADRANKYLAFDANGDPRPGDTAVDVGVVAGIENDIVVVSNIAANVTTVANNDANVTTVAGISGNVTTVANINANVTTVAGNTTNINTVATNLSGSDTIGTVAGSIADINALGPIAADIATVAGIDSDVTAVAADATDIGTVAGSIVDVNAVAAIAADVASVAADAADIGTVAGGIANVTTVAGSISSVNTAASNISAITTVASDLNEPVSEIETVAGSIANIDALGPKATDISTVAGIAANVTTVAGISSNVTTVAGISSNVSTVAGISSAVTTVAADGTDIGVVAGISSDVTTVAGIAANVTAVAGDATDIGTVATDLTGSNTIGTVAGIAANITTVAGISADVTTVAADGTDIGVVAGISSDVTTVSGIAANVTTIAGISADVTAVAADATDIGIVAADIADVSTVAGIAADVTAVAGVNTVDLAAVAAIDTEVGTVAGIAADVTAVAAIDSDVTTVVGIAANVTTVATNVASVNTNATNIANINQNAANIVDIQNASTNATNAASSATAAAASAAAANAVVLGNEPVAPSIRPSLNLDFANTRALDPRITFTRTTTATYYDGKTTAKAEENLLLRSQDYSATWTATNLTPVTGKTAPDGTSTATEFTASAANGTLTQAITAVAGDYTFSVFLRRVTGTGNIDISSHSAGTWVTQTLTGTWTRFTVTQTLTAGSRTPGIRIVDSGDVIEVWGAQMEFRSAATAYTPTTTAPITNYIPALQTAASGVARFDHRPLTGESLGLLIEEQRTNSILQSEDFTTTWSVTRASVIANTIVSPNGTLTGDKLVEDTTASNSHLISQSSLSFTSGTAYSYSLYAKAAERTVVRLAFPSAAFGASVAYNFDLVAGTATLVTAGTGNTASITAVGNGWYRCVVSAQATSTTNGTNQIFLISGGFATYTGDGYSGLYLWGAQLEAGAFPTSYIPTVAASVTRNADVATMTGTNFSSWYRADEGTLYVENEGALATPTFFSVTITDGTTEIASIRNFGNTVRFAAQGVSSASAGSTSPGVFYKASYTFKTGDQAMSVNGASVLTGTTIITSAPTIFRIGQNLSGTSVFTTHIRKLAFYPSRLSNAQLQALTTV